MRNPAILPATPPRLRWQWNERRVGIALTVLLHVVAVWGLLQLDSVRQSLIEAAPILVNIIEAPKPEAPKPTPPKPLPIQPKALPVVQPQPVAAPPAPILATPAPAVPDARPSVPEPPKVATPAPPAPISAPIFNAAYLQNPAPAYPALSRRRHEAGRVLLHVYVNASGAPEKVEVQTSSSWPRLDQAALEVVRTWRFVPAKQGGQAVAAWVYVPIEFKEG